MPQLSVKRLFTSFKSVALSTPASRLGMKYILPWVANLRTPAFNRWLLNLVPSSTVGVVRKFIDELDKTSKMLFNSKKKAILQGEDGLSTERGSGTDLMTSLSMWLVQLSPGAWLTMSTSQGLRPFWTTWQNEWGRGNFTCKSVLLFDASSQH